jgi:hypothetical protein
LQKRAKQQLRRLAATECVADPRSLVAAITLDGVVASGTVERELLKQVRRFIAINRQVLLDYWHYRIDTDELRQRLRQIED